MTNQTQNKMWSICAGILAIVTSNFVQAMPPFVDPDSPAAKACFEEAYKGAFVELTCFAGCPVDGEFILEEKYYDYGAQVYLVEDKRTRPTFVTCQEAVTVTGMTDDLRMDGYLGHYGEANGVLEFGCYSFSDSCKLQQNPNMLERADRFSSGVGYFMGPDEDSLVGQNGDLHCQTEAFSVTLPDGKTFSGNCVKVDGAFVGTSVGQPDTIEFPPSNSGGNRRRRRRRRAKRCKCQQRCLKNNGEKRRTKGKRCCACPN